jgi:hypothetical protein
MLRSGLLLVAVTLLSQPVLAEIVVEVPGSSNPWLAAQPDGTAAASHDVAPDHSPVAAAAVSPGAKLRFEVTGSVSYAGWVYGADPDGEEPTAHSWGALHGIAGLVAPIDSLIGVFLGKGHPADRAVPEALDFSDPATRSFGTLAPALQQPFFIGDGLGADGLPQVFYPPPGASTLYLGTMDAWGWYNNGGAFTVKIYGADAPATNP